MTTTLPDLETLCEMIETAPRRARRRLVAVAGPPASGKSTLAVQLADMLVSNGCRAQAMSMDGFHLDNRILEQMGRLDRKGAPDTFDVHGFERTLQAVATQDQVYVPVFRRDLELAIAAGDVIDAQCDTVIVEGNYLLTQEGPWAEISRYWDFAAFLDVPVPELERRLRERWQRHGLTAKQMMVKIDCNDLPNAQFVLHNSRPANINVEFE